MEVGDKLYCHKSCIMLHNNHKTTTVGKYYTVINIILSDDRFIIIDDDNNEHFFFISSYSFHFWSIREMRKIKLKQINECRKKIIIR